MMLKYYALLLLAVIPKVEVSAELSVASPFTNNAVLQRNVSLPVWGKADPGVSVWVAFRGQKHRSTADSEGNWKIKLEPMSAIFEPSRLIIQSSSNHSIKLENIVVGEVWICSGQSNMQMGYSGIADIKKLVPKSKNIRTFEVKKMVSFAEQDTCDGFWVEEIPKSAVAFSFAYHLEQFADAPVGIILAAWGSSSLEAWMPRSLTKSVPHFKTMMEELDANVLTQEKITSILEGPRPWSRTDDIFLRRQTNILYNAMIHPLAPYACRGFVWYQGERNTQSMHGMATNPWFSRHSGILKYGDTLNEWIQSYRQEWGNESMHFLITMLPGYYKEMQTGPKLGAEHPGSHSWGWMRESQLKALKLPHTSVVNTVDLGDIKNIHPKDKLPIGKRLALFAARDTLGQVINAHGPVKNRVEVKRNNLIVHYDHAAGLKTSDGAAPRGFWLSGSQEGWVKAEAVLDGQSIILSSSKLKSPRYVRYAFAGKPQVNLVNADGLPAYPFRTDQFKP